MIADYAPIFIVTLIALLEYFGFALAVGRARYRFGVKAPATTGNIDFERYYRGQMNTLELLIIFIPALWSCALLYSITWATWLGAIFIVGRLAYFMGYVKAAEKRSIGFGLSTIPMLILAILGLVGAFRVL